jgi:hypothetical protein
MSCTQHVGILAQVIYTCLRATFVTAAGLSVYALIGPMPLAVSFAQALTFRFDLPSSVYFQGSMLAGRACDMHPHRPVHVQISGVFTPLLCIFRHLVSVG